MSALAGFDFVFHDKSEYKCEMRHMLCACDLVKYVENFKAIARNRKIETYVNFDRDELVLSIEGAKNDLVIVFDGDDELKEAKRVYAEYSLTPWEDFFNLTGRGIRLQIEGGHVCYLESCGHLRGLSKLGFDHGVMVSVPVPGTLDADYASGKPIIVDAGVALAIMREKLRTDVYIYAEKNMHLIKIT